MEETLPPDHDDSKPKETNDGNQKQASKRNRQCGDARVKAKTSKMRQSRWKTKEKNSETSSHESNSDTSPTNSKLTLTHVSTSSTATPLIKFQMTMLLHIYIHPLVILMTSKRLVLQEEN